MKPLNYQTLKELNYDGFLLKEAPERILQFGEGNFLRAFADHFIDVMNERADFCSKVVLCQPNGSALADTVNEQEGLYTLYLRGFQNNEKISRKRVISCVSRCLNPKKDYEEVLRCAENPELRFIISNTTEAGIVYDSSCAFEDAPPPTFPAKLTQLLYRRFRTFGAETGKGFLILPCELIDDNGGELKACVLRYARQWELEDEFLHWVEEENTFCSTLVDRIVTGYPKHEADDLCQEAGYQDRLIDTGEIFGFWVIEGPPSLDEEFPARRAGLPVLITDDCRPYKQRKVRILNGAHTAFVPGAYLAGHTIVRDCMDDPVIRTFMNCAVFDEIIPTLDLPRKELEDFATAVTERFQNPFIDHALLSICLNSTSKWKARILPTLKDYISRKNVLPLCLTASFAFYTVFYQKYIPEGSLVKDDAGVLEFFRQHDGVTDRELVHHLCTETAFWGEDLSALPGFENAVLSCMEIIRSQGAKALMQAAASEQKAFVSEQKLS